MIIGVVIRVVDMGRIVDYQLFIFLL